MSGHIEQSFRELVELKYQLYNGLFEALPLDAVQQTGAWMTLLFEACQEGYRNDHSPERIIREFFTANKPDLDETEQINFLFKVIQYVERQIVLIDALEDSAYSQIHRVTGPHSWGQLLDKEKSRNGLEFLASKMDDTGIRAVLTAHPTQFYPQTVLAIIADMTIAIQKNSIAEIRDLLEQLGRTPFFHDEKPTPLDEAKLLMSHLQQVFYPAVGNLLDEIAESFPGRMEERDDIIRLGFWPGGDRDGNPFVTGEITREVAAELKHSILSCYLEDVNHLVRRLTFDGIHKKLIDLRDDLHGALHNVKLEDELTLDGVLQKLDDIENTLIEEQQGLFLGKLHSFKRKVQHFGFHFASLDIRQDSRIIHATLQAISSMNPGIFPENLDERSEAEQIDILLKVSGEIDVQKIEEPVLRDTAGSFCLIRDVQRSNGQKGAHRYIISNCRGAVDMARLFALFRLCRWDDKEVKVDIVPLFETIDDLKSAAGAMKEIYAHEVYMRHLEQQDKTQTVMLGFSDGTKDGGYLMANWSIYLAKEEITSVSRQAGVKVHFFDGRGGPPARGGGNSHMFYASLGSTIESRQVQLTLQGQTISSHYGIVEAAMHNLELLLTAIVKSKLRPGKQNNLSTEQRDLINKMAAFSYEAYMALKNHPLFMPYLVERSTLKYYGMANIGSRPVSRGQKEEFEFEDLRAIPFVGAWSQLKQNIPGYYGLGTALKRMEDDGKLDDIIQLYQSSNLFHAFVANSMQSMSKTNFAITSYMQNDSKFSAFWQTLLEEYQLTREMTLKISGQTDLLEDNPRSRQSIQLREKIVLPLLTIQQYALMRIQLSRNTDKDAMIPLYEKMVMRSLFGNINAARNAV